MSEGAEQVEAWIEKTVSQYGKLDGAANLAGVIGKQNNVAQLQDIDDEDWDFGEPVLDCLLLYRTHIYSDWC
jgi:hypothetical protein